MLATALFACLETTSGLEWIEAGSGERSAVLRSIAIFATTAFSSMVVAASTYLFCASTSKSVCETSLDDKEEGQHATWHSAAEPLASLPLMPSCS